MAHATQSGPEHLRLALDRGEVVELDGGTLVLDGEECLSVVLRVAPWGRARWRGYWRSGRRSPGCFTGRLARSGLSWSCPACWILPRPRSAIPNRPCPCGEENV
jgi:hypothetical protein